MLWRETAAGLTRVHLLTCVVLAIWWRRLSVVFRRGADQADVFRGVLPGLCGGCGMLLGSVPCMSSVVLRPLSLAARCCWLGVWCVCVLHVGVGAVVVGGRSLC
eukprot:6472456-Amphidinium_carterae.1